MKCQLLNGCSAFFWCALFKGVILFSFETRDDKIKLNLFNLLKFGQIINSSIY